MGINTPRMSGEARKKQIVHVALEVIGKYGVQGASISRIARGAGITTAALYVHFENRQAILLAALDSLYEQILDCHRVAPDGNVVERIREILRTYENMVLGQGTTGFARLFMEFVVAAPDRVLQKAVRDKESAIEATFAKYIEEGKREGTIDPKVDVEEATLRISSWAWSANVALLQGREAVWYPRLSSAIMERILEDLSTPRISLPLEELPSRS